MAQKLIFLPFGICLFVAVHGFASLGLANSHQMDTSKEITLEEAVRIAEEFIKDQGYTDTSSNLSKDEIVFESLEWTSDVDEIFRSRKGTLTPKAAGAKQSEGGWVVGFADANAPLENDRGRTVKMDLYGNNVRVMHEDFDLSFLLKE